MAMPRTPATLLVLLGLLAGTARAAYPPGCKETLRVCLDQLPPILSRSELRGIPTSVDSLDTVCQAFQTGVVCVDNFTANCLDKKQQQWVDNTMAGAKATFQMLCRNKDFRAQYLIHSRCFSASSVSAGWDNCAGRFVSIVQEEMNRTNLRHEARVMELCCARHGFLKCVHGMAKHKCGSNSAQFLTRIAETLSSVRVESKVCRHVDYGNCSRASGRASPGLGLAASVLIGLVLGLRSRRHHFF